ncbi:hypothetical protein QCA50_003425 [Cerrena zonata]|uniref:Uncharacterized protein n=1 Tax=Cerrena zonata TaxID=2478898 RepID=A0AAW0GUX6_9APHY
MFCEFDSSATTVVWRDMSLVIALPRPSPRLATSATRRATSPATAPRAPPRAAPLAAEVVEEVSLPAKNATVAARLVTLPVNAPIAPKAEEEAGTLAPATMLSAEVQRPALPAEA